MAGHHDLGEPEHGAEPTTESPLVAPRLRTTRTDRAGLVERIATAKREPPVGLILVGWEPQEAGGSAGSEPIPGRDAPSEYQVEQAVAFSIAICAGPPATILASDQAEMAVVRPSLTGSASAEALAGRIATRLDLELDRLAIAEQRTAVRWAIGVAVGRRDDRAADLLRYAEAALDDAWVLGGRRLVAFDDGDRELLGPPASAD